MKLSNTAIESICRKAEVEPKCIEGEVLFCHDPKKYYLIINMYGLSELREIMLDVNFMSIGIEMIKKLDAENKRLLNEAKARIYGSENNA